MYLHSLSHVVLIAASLPSVIGAELASTTTALPPGCTTYITYTVTLAPTELTTTSYDEYIPTETYTDDFDPTITREAYVYTTTTYTDFAATTITRSTVTVEGPTKTLPPTKYIYKSCPPWTRPVCTAHKTITVTTTFQRRPPYTVTESQDKEAETEVVHPESTVFKTTVTTSGKKTVKTTTLYATTSTFTYTHATGPLTTRTITYTTDATHTRYHTYQPPYTATQTFTLFSLQQENYEDEYNGNTANVSYDRYVIDDNRLDLQTVPPYVVAKFYINTTDNFLYQLSTGRHAISKYTFPGRTFVFQNKQYDIDDQVLKAKIVDGVCGQRVRFWDFTHKQVWPHRYNEPFTVGFTYALETDPFYEGAGYFIAVGPTASNHDQEV